MSSPNLNFSSKFKVCPLPVVGTRQRKSSPAVVVGGATDVSSDKKGEEWIFSDSSEPTAVGDDFSVLSEQEKFPFTEHHSINDLGDNQKMRLNMLIKLQLPETLKM
ncbi:uncharacterized protein LOC110647284 isoform X2 [Hevea brasiliensis]|uniref:uncharacterized protein LOC110647284 isoform X2 n=1 Tax=Hevea brasiliensis TaxID=3981 RepID=UPI000B78A721|nr:uncharacterized protein LOC110647284 isoform X2 [Hevea brasiliensis]